MTALRRSPIETSFEEALRFAGWAPQRGATKVFPNQEYVVGGLAYEFDFLFAMMVQGGEGKWSWETILDVELDGHDFHERTKEQARRDRSRDRALTRHGLTVIRFTGAEVYADARGCVDELDEIVTAEVARRSLAMPLLDEHTDNKAWHAVRGIKNILSDAHQSVQMLNNGDMSEPVDDFGKSWRDEHREAVELLQDALRRCARVVG